MAAGVLVAVLVAGCSGPDGTVVAQGDAVAPRDEWPTQDTLAGQACPTGQIATDDGEVLERLFTTVTWVGVDAPDRPLGDGASTVETPFETPGGTDAELAMVVADRPGWPPGVATATARADDVAGADAELERGASLRLGVRTAGEGTVDVQILLSLRPNGSVVAIGSCLFGALDRWTSTRVAAGAAPDQASALAAVVDADDPANAYAPIALPKAPEEEDSPAPKWDHRDPFARHWHAAPEELAANVEQRTLTVTAPPTWIGEPLLLCTRTPLAWGACLALDAEYFADGAESITSPVEPDQPLELWLVEDGLSMERRVRLGSVAADRMVGVSEVGVLLRGPGTAHRPAVGELPEQVASGAVQLEVGPEPTDGGGASPTSTVP